MRQTLADLPHLPHPRRTLFINMVPGLGDVLSGPWEQTK